MISSWWKHFFLLLPALLVPTGALAGGVETASNSTSATTAMNKLLYIDGDTGRTTLVSLDGTSENCVLEDYPATSNYPASVTYSDKDGAVLACGGKAPEDNDRCWTFDGSTWSAIPWTGIWAKHCYLDSPNVMVEDGWWITGLDGSCSPHWHGTVSEIFTGEEWIPGPALPAREEGPDWYAHPQLPCLVNLNSTHTMLIAGYRGGEYFNDVWLIDWSTKEWTSTGSLNQGRDGHGCVSLGDQGVLAVGGFGGSGYGDSLYTVELYDQAQGTWSNQPDLPKNIRSWTPIILNWNNQILGLFPDEIQIYKQSEENGEWSVLEGIILPEWFSGYTTDKAILVPDNFASKTCN